MNEVAARIWGLCENKNLTVFASYISSSDNALADSESRKLDREIEYELADYAFERISSLLGTPDVDLFASRKNFKCARYYSWKPDPGSEIVDAFTVAWTRLKFYAFPPSASS